MPPPPINPVVLKRSAVAEGILRPICSSELDQIAVNNSTHLTILDPKLPLLHEALGKATEVAAIGGAESAFHCNAFFNINTVIPWQNTVDGGVGYSNKIMLTDAERGFGFGRIVEPIVVQHAWSSVDTASRDCYLGVLANTGELFLLKRETLDPANYTVKHRLLLFLMEELNILSSRFTAEGDLILEAQEALFLRVNTFLFGELDTGQVWLNLTHENGRVALYELGAELKLVRETIHLGPSIVQLVWCPNLNSFGYFLSDNSVRIWSDSGFCLIKASSRFVISRVEPFASGLIVADTRALNVFSNSGSSSLELSFRTAVVGLSVVEQAPYTYILVVHEGGQSTVVRVDSNNELQKMDDLLAWKYAISAMCGGYQSAFRKENAKAVLQAFAPYLDENVEAELTVHGATMVFGKYIAVAHSALPRNSVLHMYVSLKALTLSFVPWTSIVPEVQVHAVKKSTFSSLIDAFLATIDSIPTFDKGVIDGSAEGVKTFLASLAAWKNIQFAPETPSLEPVQPSALETCLVQYFVEDPAIEALRRRYALNVSLFKTLASLTPNQEAVLLISDFETLLQQEQDQLESTIRRRFASIVLTCATQKFELPYDTDIDRFILLSLLPYAEFSPVEIGNIPADVTLTISTDLCTETFFASASMKHKDAENAKYVTSNSGHSWRRCDLTLMPILDFTNSTDVLEIHSYMQLATYKSRILPVLFRCMDFCVYSGTRKKTIVAGI